jgi:hypothetical protein
MTNERINTITFLFNRPEKRKAKFRYFKMERKIKSTESQRTAD